MGGVRNRERQREYRDGVLLLKNKRVKGCLLTNPLGPGPTCATSTFSKPCGQAW